MPCRDYQEPKSYLEVACIRADYQDRLDELTRLLCLAGNTLREQSASDGEIDGLEDVYAWYAEHRAADLNNMRNMIRTLNVESLSKAQFDALDKLLTGFDNV